MAAALLAKHWKWAAIGVLALLLTLAWHSRNEWKDTARSWKSAQQAQEQAYKAAQSAARVKAEAKRKEEQATYLALAERVDNAEQEVAGLRAAADRFARANSVRRPKASGSAAGGTGGAGAGGAAKVDNGPGDAAEVAVPRADFDNLVNLAIRAKQNHDWGETLLASGLAVKAEGTTP